MSVKSALSKFSGFLIGLPKHVKRGIITCVDIILCIVSVYLAYYLRLGQFVDINSTKLFSIGFAVALLVLCFSVVAHFIGIDQKLWQNDLSGIVQIPLPGR